MNLSRSMSLIFAALFLIFIPTFSKLAQFGWPKAEYMHAYFVVPIVLFMIWLKRRQLQKREDISFVGSGVFVFGLFLYLYSVLNDFLFLEATSFVVLCVALAMLILTKESFKLLIFPLSYLAFIIPPPRLVMDMATFPLKEISAHGSYLVLKLFHIPVTLYGVILNVNGHELFISDACSGFRSMSTLLSLGALYAYFLPISLGKKWIVFISVIPLGILGNIFRIALTGFLAFKFGAQAAEGFFHQFSGIVLFVITAIGLAAVAGGVEAFGKK